MHKTDNIKRRDFETFETRFFTETRKENTLQNSISTTGARLNETKLAAR